MAIVFQSAQPGYPYTPADTVAIPATSVKNLDHPPIGVTLPPAPAPWRPTIWNKLAPSFPSSQTIRHGKSPLQR